MNLFIICALVSCLAYGASTSAVLTRLFKPQGPKLVLVLGLACVAIISQCLALSQQLFSDSDVNFNLPNVISLVCLVITSLVTIVALRFKINLLLPVAYGFAALWMLIVTLMPPVGQIILTANSFVMVTHITLALVAYCILIIATLYAFQVNYINSRLKGKDLSVVDHLPPLMQVENQLFLILTSGTLCLFISQIVGMTFLDNFFAKENLHKTVLSLVALGFYTFTLWGHYRLGWRGHRVLSLTLVATGLLTLAYFGSRFVKEFLLP